MMAVMGVTVVLSGSMAGHVQGQTVESVHSLVSSQGQWQRSRARWPFLWTKLSGACACRCLPMQSKARQACMWALGHCSSGPSWAV